ncbi:hypothetical protein BsWGS_17755 [Bradybaena similaris]
MLSRLVPTTWRPRLLSSSLLKDVPDRGVATTKASPEAKCPYCEDISYFGERVFSNFLRTLGGLALLAVLWRNRKCEFVHLTPSTNEVGDCPECNKCAECASKFPAKRHRCM